MKQEVVAMLLAGGKGTRLNELTKATAKPAVNFGGKYRIIDFTLSNCANSTIKTVGVLTQYEGASLTQYIGSGQKWGLDANGCSCVVLAPGQKGDDYYFYNGTADAIYRNLSFMDAYEPEYVLILSGDHIYKMDYSKMIQFHKSKGADLTVSAINVSLKEASRFGIINANEDYSVYEFEEKPEHPKSTLASMGVYVFTYSKLKKYLEEENNHTERKEHDFGKHILPTMLADGCKMFVYPYEGYWKDVGTIDSLWQANMDLIDDDQLDLLNINSNWKIYTEDTFSPPQYISSQASVSNSLINQGCYIEGEVKHSVLFNDVKIGKKAKVIDSVILPGSVIEEGAVVKKCIVDNKMVIKANEKINKDGKNVLLVSGGIK